MISLAPLFAALALTTPQEPVSMPVELASTPAPLHGTLLTPEGQTRAAPMMRCAGPFTQAPRRASPRGMKTSPACPAAAIPGAARW